MYHISMPCRKNEVILIIMFRAFDWSCWLLDIFHNGEAILRMMTSRLCFWWMYAPNDQGHERKSCEKWVNPTNAVSECRFCYWLYASIVLNDIVELELTLRNHIISSCKVKTWTSTAGSIALFTSLLNIIQDSTWVYILCILFIRFSTFYWLF